MGSVKAKCRVCGTMAPADSFKLHYKHKMMVCVQCFKGKPAPIVPKVENKPARPPGWDEVDEYLDRAQKQSKQKEDSRFSKIPGTDQVHYACTCSYKFRYDPFRKQPRTCPYCNATIPRLRTFSLL